MRSEGNMMRSGNAKKYQIDWSFSFVGVLVAIIMLDGNLKIFFDVTVEIITGGKSLCCRHKLPFTLTVAP